MRHSSATWPAARPTRRARRRGRRAGRTARARAAAPARQTTYPRGHRRLARPARAARLHRRRVSPARQPRRPLLGRQRQPALRYQAYRGEPTASTAATVTPSSSTGRCSRSGPRYSRTSSARRGSTSACGAGPVGRFAFALPRTGSVGEPSTRPPSRPGGDPLRGRRSADFATLEPADRTDKTQVLGVLSVLSARLGPAAAFRPAAPAAFREPARATSRGSHPEDGDLADIGGMGWPPSRPRRPHRRACCTWPSAPRRPIAAATLEAAARIGEYLVRTRSPLSSGQRPGRPAAGSRWLVRRGEPTVTVRDLNRGRWTACPPEEAHRVAEQLAERGYLRPLPGHRRAPRRVDHRAPPIPSIPTSRRPQ